MNVAQYVGMAIGATYLVCMAVAAHSLAHHLARRKQRANRQMRSNPW